MLELLHAGQIREHGGAGGVRDEGAIESALARPMNRLAYDSNSDLADLAAAYAYGLASNHGFVDGNKRVAFLAAYVFLGLNGHELEAPEAEVVVVMRDLAASELGEPELASWIRANIEWIAT